MPINSGWKLAAIHDLENTNLSYNEIARKYGRHKDTIIKLIPRHNIRRPDHLQKSGKAVRDMEPIDDEHRCIGMHLTIFRGNSSPSDMAESIGVSPHRLRKMELGVCELTLVELKRISKVLNKSLGQLMTPFEAEE